MSIIPPENHKTILDHQIATDDDRHFCQQILPISASVPKIFVNWKKSPSRINLLPDLEYQFANLKKRRPSLLLHVLRQIAYKNWIDFNHKIKRSFWRKRKRFLITKRLRFSDPEITVLYSIFDLTSRLSDHPEIRKRTRIRSLEMATWTI